MFTYADHGGVPGPDGSGGDGGTPITSSGVATSRSDQCREHIQRHNSARDEILQSSELPLLVLAPPERATLP